MQSVRAAVPFVQQTLNRVFKTNDSSSLTINENDPPFRKNVKALHNILILIQMSEQCQTASDSFSIIANIYENAKFIATADWKKIKEQLNAQQNPSVLMAIDQISEYTNTIPTLYEKLSATNLKQAISPESISAAIQTTSNEMINTVIHMYSMVKNQSDAAGSLRKPIKFTTNRSGYAQLTEDEPVIDTKMQTFSNIDSDVPLVKATKLVANCLAKFNKIVRIIDGYNKKTHVSDNIAKAMAMYDLFQKIQEIQAQLNQLDIKAIQAEWRERIKINPNSPEKNIFLRDLLQNLNHVADAIESQLGLESGLLKDAINPLIKSVAEVISIESKPILLHTQNIIDYVEKSLEDLPAPKDHLDESSDAKLPDKPKSQKKAVTHQDIDLVINKVKEQLGALEKLIKKYNEKSPEEQSAPIKDQLKKLNKKLTIFEDRFMLLEIHKDQIKSLIKLANRIDKVNEKRPNELESKLLSKAKEALSTSGVNNTAPVKLPELPKNSALLNAQIIQDPLSSLIQSSDQLKNKITELKVFLQHNFDLTNTTTSIGYNVKLLIENLDKIIAIPKNMNASDLAKLAVEICLDLQKLDKDVLLQVQQAVIQHMPKVATGVATTANNALLHIISQIIQVNGMLINAGQNINLANLAKTFNKLRASLAGTESAKKAIAIVDNLEKALIEAVNFFKFQNVTLISASNDLFKIYQHLQSTLNIFNTLRPTIGNELFNKLIAENPNLNTINKEIQDIINKIEPELNLKKNLIAQAAQQQLAQATQAREMPPVPAVMQENPLLKMIKPIFDMNQKFVNNLKQFIESHFDLINDRNPIVKNIKVILSILELQQKLIMNIHPADLIAIPLQIFQQAQKLDRSALIEINKVFQKVAESSQVSTQFKELATQIFASFTQVSQATRTLEKSFSLDGLTNPKEMKENIYNAYELLSTMLLELYKLVDINVAPHLQARYQQDQTGKYARMSDDEKNDHALPKLKSGSKDPPLIVMAGQVLNFLAQAHQSVESGHAAMIQGSKVGIARTAYSAYSSFKDIKIDDKQLKAVKEEWIKIVTECGNDKLQEIRQKFTQIEKALHILPSSIENMIKPILNAIDQRVNALVLAAQVCGKKTS